MSLKNMKKQIRRETFETNSSSTHAICITKSNVDMENLPNHVTFSHGEFGWENAEYDDLWHKASYLYQAICSCYDGDKRKEVIDNLTEMLGNHNICCDFEPGDNVGYIDHGDDTFDFVKSVLIDSDRLLSYLFCNSFVVTGNDNSDGYYSTMYTDYDELKPEFNNYEVYEKGN